MKKAIISEDEYVTLKICGDHYYLTASSNSSPGNTITKLSKDEYVVNSTGEVRTYNKINNEYKSINNLKRSLKKLKELIVTNVRNNKHCIGITLTYKDNERNQNKICKDFDHFIEKCQCAFGSFKYICVLELQKRAAWHFHCVFIFASKAPFIDNSIISHLWGHGFTATKAVRNEEQLAYYYTNHYNLDLKYTTARALFSEDVIQKYTIYSDLNYDGRPEYFVEGIALRLIPPMFKIYRCSQNIEQPIEKKGRRGKLVPNTDYLTLKSTYQAVKTDEKVHQVLNVVKYEHYKRDRKTDNKANESFFEQQNSYNGGNEYEQYQMENR